MTLIAPILTCAVLSVLIVVVAVQMLHITGGQR